MNQPVTNSITSLHVRATTTFKGSELPKPYIVRDGIWAQAAPIVSERKLCPKTTVFGHSFCAFIKTRQYYSFLE